MRETTLKIQYVPTELLKTYPDNPRIIKDKQFDILKDSIKDNPLYFEARPLLCNADMIVFAGNQRLEAAKSLGLTEVPVAIMDITKDKERELLIRDNVQNGEWQTEVLANTFDPEVLEGLGLDVSQFGVFDKKESAHEEPHEASGCARCGELRKSVEGHQRRSGHKVQISP